MASPVTHALLPLVIGKTFISKEMTLRFWLFSVLCSILPDIDALGFFFGICYEGILGHRGFTHSLLFASLLSIVAVCLTPKDSNLFSGSSWKLWVYFFFLSSSHGRLDAMSNGGLGVAFLSPLDPTRYLFPWRPMKVSPVGFRLFLGEWGGDVSWSEITWVWLPSIFLSSAMKGARRLYPKWILRDVREVET